MIAFEQTFDWVIILFPCIWIIGLVLDFKYRTQRMRWIRIALWTIAIVSVSLFYLQPYQYQEKSSVRGAISANRAHRDSLRSSGYQILNQADQLYVNTFSELVVLDTALTDWQLKSISADHLTVKEPKIMGFLDYQLPVTINQGKPATITILAQFDNDVKIILTLDENLIDSVTLLSPDRKVLFQLTPKATGNFTYQLLAISESDTLAQEIIPITVEKAEQPAVLMVQGNPNFEARFIKNYLSDFGYAVSSRTRISKDIYNDEFINTNKKNLQKISLSLLRQFDLIIIDQTAFELLSLAEKRAIEQLNLVGKLGILAINTLPSQMRDLWSNKPTFTKKEVTIAGVKLTRMDLNSKVPSIKFQNQSIGYYQTSGIGKVGLLTIDNLYNLALQGSQESYQLIVQELIETLLPVKDSAGFVQIQSTPHINQQSKVQFTSTSEQPEIIIDQVKHPVRESAFRPDLFTTTFWPQKLGWNNLTIISDSVSYDYYVFSDTDWINKSKTEQIVYNQLYAKSLNPIESQTNRLEKSYWPNWFYFMVIIICMGCLWAEQRFVNP